MEATGHEAEAKFQKKTEQHQVRPTFAPPGARQGRGRPRYGINSVNKKPSPRSGILFSWIFFQEEGASLPAPILGAQRRRSRVPMTCDSVYSTFHPAAQVRNGLGGELRRSHLAAMPGL
jgi:hypothetical protein